MEVRILPGALVLEVICISIFAIKKESEELMKRVISLFREVDDGYPQEPLVAISAGRRARDGAAAG